MKSNNVHKPTQEEVKANINLMKETAIGQMAIKNPYVAAMAERLDLWVRVGAEDEASPEQIMSVLTPYQKHKIKNPMGATRKENVNNLYLTVYDGAFRQFVKDATDTSKQRTKKNGKVVNEELFSAVTGKLKKLYTYVETIETKDAKVDVPFLVIYMKADGDKDAVVIQCPFKQSFAQTFLMRLKNLDLSKEFELRPYTIKNEKKSEAKGKDVYQDYLIPYQGEGEDGKLKKVPAYFSKETPNGLPEIIVKYKKDKVTVANVDTIDRDEFLEEMVKDINKTLNPGDKAALEPQNGLQKGQNVLETIPTGEDDDLPF